VCAVSEQNGGDGFYQEEESSPQQLFHIHLWIMQKNLGEQVILERDSVTE
jgi:hypothetical protein